MDKNCWQTPQWILDGVDRVFGKDEWFDPFPPNYERCAMSYKWGKPAFCNPPYGRGFLEKFASYGVKQNVPQIWLTNNDCSTGWFDTLACASSYFCLLSKRVKFINPVTGLKVNENPRSQVLFFVHNNKNFSTEFIDYFGHHGIVVTECVKAIPF